MLEYVFDHVGITTTEPQPQEDWVEASRIWVTNPRNHPEHIEFLRYREDSTVPAAVRDNPHVAYRVKELEPVSRGLRNPDPALHRRRLPRSGVRAQARHDLRIHALPQGRLVRELKHATSSTADPTYSTKQLISPLSSVIPASPVVTPVVSKTVSL